MITPPIVISAASIAITSAAPREDVERRLTDAGIVLVVQRTGAVSLSAVPDRVTATGTTEEERDG